MELLILVLVGAVIITAIADRRGMQPALIIVVVALAVSFVPGMPHVELESEILLTVVLPPLLYSAALGFSVPSFVRNIKPILGLGVAMVVITAFAVGWIASLLIPSSPSRWRCCSGRSSHRPTRSPPWRSDASSDCRSG